MRFNFKNLEKVNMEADNIFTISVPLHLIVQKGDNAKKVIFLGSGFKNLPRDLDVKEYINITNKCLDFLRRECSGYELIYRLHPAETDEYKSLNLESFKIEDDKTVAEFYFYKNWADIKYVFSAHSNASVSALSFGLNSYVFFKLFRHALGNFASRGFEDFFKNTPNSFFIQNLGNSLKNNRIVPKQDYFLQKQWSEFLEKNKGKVWFVVDDPGFLPVVISFARLIKGLDQERRVGLLVIKIDRWDRITVSDMKKEFDDIVFSPRIYYSFKPWKIWTLLKTAFSMWNFKINLGDIIFGIGPEQFQINCLVSYFKKNLRIGFITQTAFNVSHNFATPPVNSEYSIKSQRWFFIHFVEPFLGLYHTVGRLQKQGDRGGFGIARYWRSLNKIFDIVYIVKPVDLVESGISDVPQHP